MNSQAIETLPTREGWYVLHLFYSISHGVWQDFNETQKRAALSRLSDVVLEATSQPSTQLLAFSMVTPKADLGFMLLCPDLLLANTIEKRLTLSLGADVLDPVFSYLSMTETSEYSTTDEDYARTLAGEQGLVAGTPDFEQKMGEFRERMTKYTSDRLYPNMPDWPVFCFYPMSKRREADQNWYRMNFEERKKLMLGHGRVGRTYSGRVRQLITGSTGLDDAEWGVSLFANDLIDIKSIVYEMRFDAVSADYADFGQFYIGLQLPLAEIFRRLQLLPS
jgi:chlorite dismutase